MNRSKQVSGPKQRECVLCVILHSVMCTYPFCRSFGSFSPLSATGVLTILNCQSDTEHTDDCQSDTEHSDDCQSDTEHTDDWESDTEHTECP